MGCQQQQHSNPIHTEAISIIQNSLEEKFFLIIKHHQDFPDDLYNEDIYKKACLVYNTGTRIDSLLQNQDQSLSSGDLSLSNNRLLDSYKNEILIQLGDYKLQMPPLINHRSMSIDETRIALLCHNLNTINMLSSQLIAYCGMITKYDLKTITEKTKIKLGEPFTCMNLFGEIECLDLNSESAFNIDKITRNGQPYLPEKTVNRFNNGYFEFTPEDEGEYTVFISKKRKRASGKVETYNTQVNFVVFK
jgi:hypothetical protein